MAKSPDAFRTIREVSEWLETPAHVLRFWESKFSQIRPVKRAGGRRYYRPNDMLLLGGIKRLLHEDGHTIKRVQRMLGTDGIKAVAALSQPLSEDQPEAPATKTSESALKGSFVSSRAENKSAPALDLAQVEDAEIIEPTPPATEAPKIAKVNVPPDPADKEFEMIPAPVSAGILSGRLRVRSSDQHKTITTAIDCLKALRDSQVRDRLL